VSIWRIFNPDVQTRIANPAITKVLECKSGTAEDIEKEIH
jgi:hypothetical protein